MTDIKKYLELQPKLIKLMKMNLVKTIEVKGIVELESISETSKKNKEGKVIPDKIEEENIRFRIQPYYIDMQDEYQAERKRVGVSELSKEDFQSILTELESKITPLEKYLEEYNEENHK